MILLNRVLRSNVQSDDRAPTLLRSWLRCSTPNQVSKVARRLLSLEHSPGRPGRVNALRIVIDAPTIDCAALLADLVVALARFEHPKAAETIVKFFGGVTARTALPHPVAGDVALFWDHPGLAEHAEDRNRLRMDIARAKPPKDAAWFAEWFTTVASLLFAHNYNDARLAQRPQFIELLARDDEDRRRLADALFGEWAGTFEELDDTITNLTDPKIETRSPART